jgi:sorting nexin-29
LPQQRKEPITVPTYKNGDKIECNNYRGISLLSSGYKILFNILLDRLNPYVNEIIGDHQCGFRRNRSAMDQVFYICQIIAKKWEYNGTMHHLFIDFKAACVLIKREVI